MNNQEQNKSKNRCSNRDVILVLVFIFACNFVVPYDVLPCRISSIENLAHHQIRSGLATSFYASLQGFCLAKLDDHFSNDGMAVSTL